MNKKLNPKYVWDKYQKSNDYNNQIGLYDTVKKNEAFFIGDQWKNVQANGLPTPVFNFLKRVTLFQVASICTDNIKMQASPLASTSSYELSEIDNVADIVTKQFESIFERNRVVSLIREYVRNAAVDGDGCLYSYFDPDIETGQRVKGDIVTEVLDNTRVKFGDPNERRVQKQPWIIIDTRERYKSVRRRAKDNGSEEADTIFPDTDDVGDDHQALVSDKCTVLLYLYRDDDTKTIWKYETTKTAEVSPPVDTGMKYYPITWLQWDYVLNSYHGQALITGLIPNQIFVNKLFAMSMISLMTTAYPKVVYDKTRISSWDSRVGAAIGVNGGDMNNVAKIVDPAQISPQIAQFISLAIDTTQSLMGATDAALGDTRPDNTSAIIALQRASNVPLELVSQNLYQSIEDLGRIYIDMMRVYYGTRTVTVTLPTENAPLGMNIPDRPMNLEWDFSRLEELPVSLKLDVGASSYWSEIASMQTLDNLLINNKISTLDYLERVPSGYISRKQDLVNKYRQQEGQQLAQADAGAASGGTGQLVDFGQPLEVSGGKGNGALQRAINAGGAAV